MTYAGLTRAQLDQMIADGLAEADDAVRAAWERMRIEPETWRCNLRTDTEAWFWVVAERDGRVVWYNDIEGGFNESGYSQRGVIAEYRCNQTDFAVFLCNLPEGLAAEEWPDCDSTTEVPRELDGGAEIARRQTTYWELRSARGALYRVHFKGKAEARFAGASCSAIALVDTHPVLASYHERSQQLFVRGTVARPAALLEVLANRVREASAGWRTFDEYRGPMDWTLGHGLALRGPASVVECAARALADHGVQVSILDGRGPTERYRALVMGRSYIVARAFKIVRLEEESTGA
jgi:hypothetical protein